MEHTDVFFPHHLEAGCKTIPCHLFVLQVTHYTPFCHKYSIIKSTEHVMM